MNKKILRENIKKLMKGGLLITESQGKEYVKNNIDRIHSQNNLIYMLNIWKNQPKTNATRYIISYIENKLQVAQPHINNVSQKQQPKEKIKTLQDYPDTKKYQSYYVKNKNFIEEQKKRRTPKLEIIKEGGKYKLIRKYKNLRRT